MKKILLLLPALALAVDCLIPPTASAQVYGINITSSSGFADLSVYLTSSSGFADKSVYVAGRCRGRGSTDVYLTTSSGFADESWYPTSSSAFADMSICLSGDIDEWFDQANY